MGMAVICYLMIWRALRRVCLLVLTIEFRLKDSSALAMFPAIWQMRLWRQALSQAMS